MTEHSVAEFWIPALIIAMGAIVVILETFGGIRAAYGRYNKSNFGLPSWIAWCLQESTSFFVSLIIWIYRGPQLFDSNGRLNTNLLLLAYFMFHYFHRSFVYSLRIQSNKKLNYLENMFGFFFCTINGLQIAHYHILYPNFALNQWNFWLGSALFWLGLYINIDSDNRLLRLRSSSSSSSKSSSTKSAYKIPQGGFFEYVSAANYAGECLEWLGFAIASWSLSGFAFSFFTFANIGPRAYHHHLYYKELFGDKYPKNRKALIPFLL